MEKKVETIMGYTGTTKTSQTLTPKPRILAEVSSGLSLQQLTVVSLFRLGPESIGFKA